MTDPTDKRIEELWQYIPPYTAPNHPPQVEVITTTNTGDTPMTEEDPDLLAGDNLDRLRGRNLTEELENARYQNNLLTEECRELEKERDEARLQTVRILNEIDCRIEHGADSNGHLEAIRNLFKENTNEPWSAEKHDAIARHIKDTVNKITENTRKAVPQKIDLFKENS